MRILLALSVIIVSVQYGRCKLELKRDKEVIVDIDSPELHQSQYHTADFDTSAYNYGYAVEPNGQFHHETRGGDGVTYGCYGYIDSDDLLKVTHYVADSQGYRTLEHEKPVLVYPINENNVDADEKPRGVMLDWKDLYFPIGCGMAKGGVLLDAPVFRAPGGSFQQLGETKFPVHPSSEPKVVVPPFNIGIKTEPTKLIPISTVVSTNSRQPDPKTTIRFSTSNGVNPSTGNTQIPNRVSTQSPNIDSSVNGPEYDTKISYRQSQRPTIPPSSSFSTSPTRVSSPSSFSAPTKFNEPSTTKSSIDTVKLQQVTSSERQSDYTEELLPPFRTTNVIGTRTTIGLPINSFDPSNDLNVINSYANFNPDTPTTTQSGYTEEITTTVPTRNQPFSITPNNKEPSTFSGFTRPSFYPTERISTPRPNRFDGFNFNIYTQTTTEAPIDLVTEPNSDSTNPESTTVLTSAVAFSSPEDGSNNGPYTNQRPKDISYQTSVKFSSNQDEPTRTRFGVSSSISAQRPAAESYTTPNDYSEFETTTLQSTYPGIGDYNKPLPGFEFNIPTKAPNQASPQSFVTISTFATINDEVTTKDATDGYAVENKDPIFDKTTQFTNGPHGAEYQLGSRIPHSQFPVTYSRDNNFNFLNPIKQSRKDGDANNPPISLITPLTHLTIAGSFPSKNNATATSIETSQSTKFSTNPSADRQPSTQNPTERLPVLGLFSEVNTPERETNRPNSQHPTSFFTVTTPKSEPTRGIITHMNAISQTRFQSSRVTPSLASITSNDEQKSNDVFPNQPVDYFTPDVQKNIQASQPAFGKPTEYPFLYTRSRTTPSISPYVGETSPGSSSYPDSITPSDELTIYSGFGQQNNKPGTTSFTAYHPESTSRPSYDTSVDRKPSHNPVPYEGLPYQPKFVLRPAANSNRKPLSNFNGYPDADIRNANYYPDSDVQKANDGSQNNIQPGSKYVNTKKEFVPQYNPSSPVPGSLGTAIGVYPPNVNELLPEIPNFSIAISKWPFYILPFPFTNGNLMTFPLLNGMPIQLGGNIPTVNFNAGPNTNSGSDYIQGVSSVGGSGGNGAPAQSICSWLSSFLKPKDNATNTETPTNENGETLQISNLQVNVKNPQVQVNQNQIPFGIVGFIPIIAVPNCQQNVQGDGNVDPNALPTSIQIPNLCTQLSQLLGVQTSTQDTNQSSPT